MSRLESRLARLEVRTPRTAGESPGVDTRALTAPERTAAVVQILVDVGVLEVSGDGEIHPRAGYSW